MPDDNEYVDIEHPDIDGTQRVTVAQAGVFEASGWHLVKATTKAPTKAAATSPKEN